MKIQWNITGKLILMNAFIVLVIGGIVLVVNVSFRTIHDSLTDTIHEEVNLVIQNSQAGRELNNIFIELRVRARSLYGDDKQHANDIQVVLDNISSISEQVTSEKMRHFLTLISDDLRLLFAERELLRDTIRQLQGTEDRLFELLDELEQILSEHSILFAIDGKDSFGIDQIKLLLPGYWETVVRLGGELEGFIHYYAHHYEPHDDQAGHKGQHQLIIEKRRSTWSLLFQDLESRFRTLLSSEKDVALCGEELIATLERYKQHATDLNKQFLKLYAKMDDVHEIRNSLQVLMTESDKLATQATRKIQKDVRGIIKKSQRIMLILTLIVLIVVIIGWSVTHWMTRPLVELSNVAARLAAGDLDCQISDSQTDDEIGTLARAFKDLMEYFREMAYTANEISRGNLSHEVRPRSPKDAFGNGFERMIGYLMEIGEIAGNISKGDLRKQVELQSARDQLGRNFREMQKALGRVIEGIRSGADYLSSISAEVLDTATNNAGALKHIGNAADVTSSAMLQMKASAEDVHLSTELLRSSVEETSTSISEMTSSVKHIAENSRKLSRFADTTVSTVTQIVQSLETVAEQAEHSRWLSEATTRDAESGRRSMEQMISGMTAISEVTEHIAGIIASLEARSLEIGTILDVINEVAEQTSLLALNASIIAAQAGSHGRGFAVVADEIKELATRVGTSTNEISKIIKGVQKDSSDAAKVIELGRHEVKTGVCIANEAGDALNKIGESAEHSSEVAAEIAVLVRQQSSSSKHVGDSVKDMAEMISEISYATEQQEGNSSLLLQIVENMEQLAEQVLRAMKEQQISTQHVTEFMSDVTSLVDQNTSTVERLATTAHELAEQAEHLNRQVEHFQVPGQVLPQNHLPKELPEELPG
ncbi:hypothetical protein CSA57_06420 [candidate division KSB3 bacterium]|nr:MAG: hypothetical protein CSA57_06420 [candidate division KSB3 bacterium]